MSKSVLATKTILSPSHSGQRAYKVTCIAIELPIKYPATVSIYVCLMEALSILENLRAAGVPIPDFVTQKAKEIDDEINHGSGPKEKE